ncbi:MAG: hypothetical protein H0U16_12405 [Actinobacteria bacterium]|nr:hypothetical protein [Actinomycetota bacterium]
MFEPDSLPVTVLLPETVADPIVMYDSHAALRMAVVERDFVRRLGPEWDQPGNYVLLDPVTPEGKWGTYAGKAAPGGVRSRLMTHLRSKDHWRRALLIQRDTTHGFNSAQVAWLEGRLYDLLDASENAILSNANRPSDETLPAFERATLEACVLPVSRVLRLLGHDPATGDDSGTVAAAAVRPRTSRFNGITLADIIGVAYLDTGTRLVSVNGAWPASAEVSQAGGIEMNGTEYPTPSAAASAVKSGAPVNGWDFWAVEEPSGKTTLATLRARYLDARDSPS